MAGLSFDARKGDTLEGERGGRSVETKPSKAVSGAGWEGTPAPHFGEPKEGNGWVKRRPCSAPGGAETPPPEAERTSPTHFARRLTPPHKPQERKRKKDSFQSQARNPEVETEKALSPPSDPAAGDEWADGLRLRKLRASTRLPPRPSGRPPTRFAGLKPSPHPQSPKQVKQSLQSPPRKPEAETKKAFHLPRTLRQGEGGRTR